MKITRTATFAPILFYGGIFIASSINSYDSISVLTSGGASISWTIFITLLAIASLVIAIWAIKGYMRDSIQDDENYLKAQISLAKKARAIDDIKNSAGDEPIKFTYLRGSGLKFTDNSSIILAVHENEIVFIEDSSMVKTTVNFNDILRADVSGPGTETSNAGISGGGFGVEGFIKGVAIAAAVNAITSKSTTNTFLHISGKDIDGYFHSSMVNPDKLSSMIYPLLVSIQKRTDNSEKQISSVSIADEIDKLKILLNDGFITSEEFSMAKKKLITKE